MIYAGMSFYKQQYINKKTKLLLQKYNYELCSNYVRKNISEEGGYTTTKNYQTTIVQGHNLYQ